jgi:hypothetical protein
MGMGSLKRGIRLRITSLARIRKFLGMESFSRAWRSLQAMM